MRTKSDGSSDRPWLRPGDRLDPTRVRELIDVVRRLGGDELLVKRTEDPASAGPIASRMRRVLGTDFYVRRSGRSIWVRARRSGEPELRKHKLRMGPEWMTVPAAARRLGISEVWLRRHYMNAGHIDRYRFGTRVVVPTDQVEELRGELAPGGAIVGTNADRPRPDEGDRR